MKKKKKFIYCEFLFVLKLLFGNEIEIKIYFDK